MTTLVNKAIDKEVAAQSQEIRIVRSHSAKCESLFSLRMNCMAMNLLTMRDLEAVGKQQSWGQNHAEIVRTSS